MSKIVELLEKKGIIASLVGFLLVAPVNGYTIYRFFIDKGLTEGQIEIFIWVNIVAWVWVILPSKISLKSDKLTIEIED